MRNTDVPGIRRSAISSRFIFRISKPTYLIEKVSGNWSNGDDLPKSLPIVSLVDIF
jgi:hypothetical protein